MPRFRVHCANPTTGEETDWEVQCATVEEATKRALSAGFLVSGAELVSDPPPNEAPVSRTSARRRTTTIALLVVLALAFTGYGIAWLVTDERIPGTYQPGITHEELADWGVFALFLLLMLAGLVAMFLLAAAPGHIAKTRRHRQADAIRMLGWCGVFIPVLWLVAVIWAHTEDNR